MCSKTLFNSLVAMAALSLGAVNAQAALQQPIVCSNARGDQGDTVVFRKDAQGKVSASVNEVTFYGTRTMAVLVCNELPRGQTTHPDAIVTLIACREPNMADGGYVVTLQSGGYAGLTWAEVSEQTIMGPRALTSVPCSQRE